MPRRRLKLDPLESVPQEEVAKWLGMEEEDLPSVAGSIGKAVDGRYPMSEVIYGVIALLREQRDYMTNGELAELQGISEARVSIQLREGILKQDEKGKYLRKACVHGIVSHLRTRIGEGKTTAAAAKNEGMELDNELRRIAVAKARGKAWDAAEVEKAWAGIILTVREKLLRLANKLAPRIPYLKSESEVEAAIDAEVRECLSELARPVEYATETTTEEGE